MGLCFNNGIRQVEYLYVIVRNGVEYCRAVAIGSPSISAQATAEVKKSIRGSFIVPKSVDFLTDTLRVSMLVDGTSYQLGEFVAPSITERHTNGHCYIELEAYDLAYLVQASTLDERVVIAAGTAYLDAIKSQLLASGVTSVIAEPCTDVVTETRADWEIGDSRLTVINTLLSEIIYRPLWFDNAGNARLTRRVPATAETITKTYTADAVSIIAPDITSCIDIYGAYNDWIVVVSNPDKNIMIARATNNDPTSRLSVQRIGKHTAPIVRLNNIASRQALQDHADSLRLAGMTATEQVEWNTANVPHDMHEVVAITHHDLNGIFEETEWEMTLQAGAEMRHKGKRVVYV